MVTSERATRSTLFVPFWLSAVMMVIVGISPVRYASAIIATTSESSLRQVNVPSPE